MAAPLLGAAGALKAIMSGHTFGLPISDAQARDIMMTFHSTHFLNPRSSQRSRKGNGGGNSNSNFTVDYKDPIVTLKSITGSSEFPFSIDDVENGEIFRLMGNMLREDRMLEKYHALHDLYTNDPLKPLDKLYKRPPIKHVIMIYGVDIPTEVGYTYRTPDGSNPGPPILDEILYEEPCKRKLVEDEELDTRDAITVRPTERMCAVSEDPALTATGSGVSNAPNTAEKDGTCDDMPFRDRWLQSTEFDWASTMTAESTVSQTHAPSSADNNVVRYDEGGDDDGSSSTGWSYSRSEASSSTAVSTRDDEGAGKAISKDTQKAKKERRYADCNAEVYAVKTKKQALSQQKRRFVRYSEQKHSGDYTVPYVSLSYAHTWLDGGTEEDNKRWHEHRPRIVHRHLLDNFAPSAMASKVAAVDPAVDLYYSERADGDTTAVIEVSGIDHLDIAKSSYVHFLIFENLLPKIAADLCLLNQTESACNYEQSTVPFAVPDFHDMSKRATEAAKDALNSLMKYVKGS
jgi:hypothetical protein